MTARLLNTAGIVGTIAAAAANIVLVLLHNAGVI